MAQKLRTKNRNVSLLLFNTHTRSELIYLCCIGLGNTRIPQQDAKEYHAAKAAAIAAGPEEFKKWAADVAAKGYSGVSRLHQHLSNDDTRAKAATAALDSLNAYVRHFTSLMQLPS